MPLGDYVNVIWKRWWILVMAAFLAAGSAYVYSKMQQPIFRASAKLYVTPFRPDYGVTLVIQNLIRQYSTLLASDRFLISVSEELRLDVPAGELRRRIHAAGAADNLVIQVDVDDPDPARAQAIAKALANKFVADHQLRMEKVDPRDKIEVWMYDDPQPGTLHQPKTRVNVMAGGILGLLIGLVIAFVMEYLDDTIKDAEDVQRYVELPVVGSIPTMGS